MFFTSDSHFSHQKMVEEFVNEDGSPARIDPRTGKRFESIEDHDEFLIEQWNKTVPIDSKVYHCGDFAFDAKTFTEIIPRLNGRITLIVGNHDPIQKVSCLRNIDESKMLRDVMLWKIFNSSNTPHLNRSQFFTLSHIPLAKIQFKSKSQYNVHGHIHNFMQLDESGEPDPSYINICVEQTSYAPISLEDLICRMKDISQ